VVGTVHISEAVKGVVDRLGAGLDHGESDEQKAAEKQAEKGYGFHLAPLPQTGGQQETVRPCLEQAGGVQQEIGDCAPCPPRHGQLASNMREAAGALESPPPCGEEKGINPAIMLPSPLSRGSRQSKGICRCPAPF
jgi:hypothetical protein